MNVLIFVRICYYYEQFLLFLSIMMIIMSMMTTMMMMMVIIILLYLSNSLMNLLIVNRVYKVCAEESAGIKVGTSKVYVIVVVIVAVVDFILACHFQVNR